VGVKKGFELAQYYASADVFVFPSLTDTFGIVNIEAIACGTPVAAFPVTGPRDIVTQGVNGYLSDNLHHAIEQALRLKGQIIHTTIEQYTWSNAAQQFLNQLVRIEWTHD
jgi:glycosyltransferase involved in cell wall biosynthesis